jgi:type IV secretion system protein VirB5
MKLFTKSAIILFMYAFLPTANALTVYDPANHRESIKQYVQLVEQLKNMSNQLKLAEQEYAAMTGARGMGNIQTGTDGKKLPHTWQEMLAATGGDGKLKKLADDIREKADFLKDEDLNSINQALRNISKTNRDAAINATASNAADFEDSSQRFERMKVLMDKIETATDLKAIADLQARIQVESVMLQNDAMRAQSMNAMIQSQQKVQEQKERESMKLKRRSSASTKTE